MRPSLREGLAARRSVAGLIVAGLAFVTAACGSDTPSSAPSAIAGPAGSAVASSTTDTVVGDPLAAFEGRLRDATTREGELVRALAAASAGSAADLRLAVAEMRDWVDRERAWLADHPALECYQAADARYREAIDAMAASADAFEAGAQASPAPGPSGAAAGAAAARSLQDAARALLDSAALAKTARTSCR